MKKEKDPELLEITDKIDGLNEHAWEIHVTDPKLALKLSSEAKNLAEEYNYKKGIAYATRNLGVSYRYLSNFDTALSNSLMALDMFVESGDKSGESQALVSIGAIYYYMGDYDKGLDYFENGLQIGEEAGNKEAVTYAYNGAGYIYNILGDLDKGLNYLHKSLLLSREIKNFVLEASILDSIAVAYLNDGQLDKAYETYITCLHLSEQNHEKRNQGYALFGIGEILFKKNKSEEAKEHLLKSLEIHKSIGYQIGMAHSLLHLGRIFLHQNNYEDAANYLQESLEIGESIKAKVVIYEAHEAFSVLYQSLKDFDKFVEHYKLYNKYKSEVFKEELETKQKYQNIQYEVEKLTQEAEINRLTNVVMKEKNEELEKSYNSVSLLSKIGQDITSTINLETILNTIYKNVNEMMDATVFGIGILKQDGKNIEYRLSMEKGKRYQPYERSMDDKNQFSVWCIDNKSEVFINDIETEFSKYLPNMDMAMMNSAEMEDGSRPENPHSLIYLPLIVKDKIIGLISVQSYHKNAYTAYHLNILKTLASYASAALYNAQSYMTLQNTLNELKKTQEQLVQQEKLASLGQLTAGIAHEIKNPLNFVNNFSEVSVELVEEAREEVRRGTEDGGPSSEKKENLLSPHRDLDRKRESDPSADGGARGVSGGAKSGNQPQHSETDSSLSNTPLSSEASARAGLNPSASWRREAGSSPDSDLLLEILDDIEANLRKIHEHGTRADGIVKAMLQHSRGGDGKMEPSPLNPIIKEYVNLAFHGMRAGKEPINVDIDLHLDENVGEVPLVAEDFSRVILNLTNNAFDAMRDKLTGDGGPGTEKNSLRQPAESAEAERRRGVSSSLSYHPKLTVRTHQSEKTITIEIEDNGPGIPDEIKDKIMLPFFTTKKGTQGTGLGLSITNDIVKAHGGVLNIASQTGKGTTFSIELPIV